MTESDQEVVRVRLKNLSPLNTISLFAYTVILIYSLMGIFYVALICYILLINNMNLIFEQNHQEVPNRIIDNLFINEILEKLRENEYDDFDKTKSYEYSVELSHIFADLYNSGEVEGQKNDSFLFSEYWTSQEDGTMSLEFYVLLITMRSVVENGQRLESAKLNKIVNEITNRWLNSVHSFGLRSNFDISSLNVKMRQIVYVSLIACSEEDNTSAGLDEDGSLVAEIFNEKNIKLSEKDIEQMEQIYIANYSDKPELQQILLNSFREKIKSNKGKFIIARFDGDIIGYYELENLGENRIHFGKFNVSPGLDGIGIGNLLLDKKFNIEAKQNIMLAECDLYAKASQNYLRNGFCGYKLVELGEIAAMSIARNDSSAIPFKSKDIKVQDIFDMDSETRDPIIENSSKKEFNLSDDIVIVKFPWWDDPYMFGPDSWLTNTVRDIFGRRLGDKRYVMTRILERKNINDEGNMSGADTYYIFELVKDIDFETYINEFKNDKVK